MAKNIYGKTNPRDRFKSYGTGPSMAGSQVREDVPDPYSLHPGNQNAGAYGQGLLGPGYHQSASNFQIDLAGGGYDGVPSMMGTLFADNNITNMSDLYDYYLSAAGSNWGDFLNMGTSDAAGWQDWYNNNWGTLGYSNSTVTGDMNFGDGTGYGGGTIGGQGDLGTGNVFIGGGMANNALGFEMSGQDCATLGPQFNSSGECISCCESQYAGTGFYGDPNAGNMDVDDMYPDGPGLGDDWNNMNNPGFTLDDDFTADEDCLAQFSGAQGAGYAGSYSDFSSLYCP